MPVHRRTLADDPAALTDALATLGHAPVVGVDVERADADQYWRHPALIQIGSAGTVVLVDPLAVPDLGDLATFVAERTVVLHAMENDIAPLADVGVVPPDVHDTAIAAGLLGLPVGLETLLDDLLGVTLDGDKQRMQRADWARRPLSDEMLEYAAADVADLPRLWAELERRLHDAGRYDWYEQERTASLDLPAIEDRRSWTRMRGLGRLDRRAQTRARSLWDVRESLARETDTAPGRIIGDRALLAVAARPVSDIRGLRARGMRRQAARRFGGRLLDALRAGQDATLVPQRARRLDERDRGRVDELRRRRSRIADELGIDPGLLCPNRALERAVASRPQNAEQLRDALDLRPWQWEQVADAFRDALNLES